MTTEYSSTGTKCNGIEPRIPEGIDLCSYILNGMNPHRLSYDATTLSLNPYIIPKISNGDSSLGLSTLNVISPKPREALSSI